MEWSKALDTGNQRIDQEHKELFNLTTQILELDSGHAGGKSAEDRKDKVERVVKFLGEYTVKHFAHEEELMAECKYPGRNDHLAEHKAFFPVFENLKQKIVKDGATLAVSLEVNNVLVKWLTNHIMNSDKKLASFLKTAGK